MIHVERKEELDKSWKTRCAEQCGIISATSGGCLLSFMLPSARMSLLRFASVERHQRDTGHNLVTNSESDSCVRRLELEWNGDLQVSDSQKRLNPLEVVTEAERSVWYCIQEKEKRGSLCWKIYLDYLDHMNRGRSATFRLFLSHHFALGRLWTASFALSPNFVEYETWKPGVPLSNTFRQVVAED